MKRKIARLLQHRRHGHVRSERLRETTWSDWVSGMDYLGAQDRIKCNCCMCINAKKAPFQREAEERSLVPGERIHSDVKELRTPSIEGHLYAVCFIDDATRRAVSYPMKKKSEVIEKLRLFLESECTARGKLVRILRSDNGGEYTSDEMVQFCSSRGIWQEYSPPHCQSANGVAEVFWRDAFRLVRAILWDQQRHHKYWACALRFATCIRNHLMHHAVEDMPPEAAWLGKPVDVDHFRVPLSTCWSYIEKDNREGTLGRRRMQGILVGYATHSPSYLVYDPETHTVYNRRYADVEVDERSRAPEESERVDDKDVKQLEAFFDKLEELTMPPTAKEEHETETANEDTTSCNKSSSEETTATEETPAVTAIPRAQEEKSSVPSRPNNAAKEREENEESHAGLQDMSIERWYRTTRSMRVHELAKLFNKKADDYLDLLHEYEGWYQQLIDTMSIVNKGSDVPIPVRAAPPVPAPSRSRNRKRKSTITIQGVQPQGVPPAVQLEASKGVRRSLRTKQKETAQTALLSHRQEIEKIWRAYTTQVLTAPDPKSVRDAMSREDSTNWKKAMNKEWTGLWMKEAFERQEWQGQKLHRMMWVFKRKNDGTYKARLVFDGRRQDPATYSDIHSPTMKLTSFRVLLAIATQNGWRVWADDATQAFLNAKRPADKPLYAAYPAGFDTPAAATLQACQATKRSKSENSNKGKHNKMRNSPRHCLLVKRQLYGLHDAPMGWYLEVQKHMLEQGFKQSKNDQCLFHKPGCYVVCHVDDFASTGDPATVAEFRRNIHAKFKMTGSEINEYYGLQISQDLEKGEGSISCEKYIERAMQKLELSTKQWATPMEQYLDLPVRLPEEKPDPALHRRFRQIVGCAMHPSVTCRPDVSAAVRALSVHLQNPGQEHIKAAERVMQYLHCTKQLKLTYRRSEDLMSSFFGTCDAAHNVTKDAKGITGWSYQLGQGSICWKCRTQGLTAMSSTEAELIAVDEAAREAQYLHKLLKDFGIQVSDHLPTFIGQDNMSTIALIQSSHWNARTKHVSLRFHHTGELQRNGEIKVQYLQTDQMPADLLTKPLASEPFRRHRAVLLGHEQLTPSLKRRSQMPLRKDVPSKPVKLLSKNPKITPRAQKSKKIKRRHESQ